MAVGFGGVAGGARAAPVEHITGKVRPDIPSGDEAASGPATWVGKIVEMLENEVAEWPRNQWSENSSGDVAVELVAGDRVRRDGEGGGVQKLLSFWAGQLVLCQGEGGEFRKRRGKGSSGRRRRQCWAGPGGWAMLPVTVSVTVSVVSRRGEGRVAVAASGGSGWAGPGGRERASATVLAVPGVWVAVMANSEMKASWRCWRPDLGGERRWSAERRGLWSVKRKKGRPSR
jgi:hypothetical protein